jgi:hypothetical protein
VSTNGLAERDPPIYTPTQGGGIHTYTHSRVKEGGTTLKIDNPIRQPVTHRHVLENMGH